MAAKKIGTVTDKPNRANGHAWRIDCGEVDGKRDVHFLAGIDRPNFGDYEVGDRVVLEYRTGPAYGLWFVAGKAGESK